ncbi:hypothetical protein CEQ90_13680 [Lewinellaceae bacterium SD302]|nr:hypothetical protein CEQ90_13680 [Lewinellaceae bacterium SD302]
MRSLIKNYAMRILPLFLLLLASCQVNNVDLKSKNSGDTIIMWVAHYQVPCVGSGAPRLCLLTQDNKEIQPEEWKYFYSQIIGFDAYEMGWNYLLSVRKTKRVDVPADAGLFRYELIKIVDKQKVDRELEFEFSVSDGTPGLPAAIRREQDGSITLVGETAIILGESLDNQALESAIRNEQEVTGVFTHAPTQNKLILKKLKTN